jgi:hypothetical protein
VKAHRILDLSVCSKMAWTTCWLNVRCSRSVPATLLSLSCLHRSKRRFQSSRIDRFLTYISFICRRMHFLSWSLFQEEIYSIIAWYVLPHNIMCFLTVLSPRNIEPYFFMSKTSSFTLPKFVRRFGIFTANALFIGLTDR